MWCQSHITRNKCQNEHSYMRYVIGEITVRDKGTPVQNRQREFRLGCWTNAYKNRQK